MAAGLAFSSELLSCKVVVISLMAQLETVEWEMQQMWDEAQMMLLALAYCNAKIQEQI